MKHPTAAPLLPAPGTDTAGTYTTQPATAPQATDHRPPTRGTHQPPAHPQQGQQGAGRNPKSQQAASASWSARRDSRRRRRHEPSGRPASYTSSGHEGRRKTESSTRQRRRRIGTRRGRTSRGRWAHSPNRPHLKGPAHDPRRLRPRPTNRSGRPGAHSTHRAPMPPSWRSQSPTGRTRPTSYANISNQEPSAAPATEVPAAEIPPRRTRRAGRSREHELESAGRASHEDAVHEGTRQEPIPAKDNARRCRAGVCCTDR